MLGYHFAYTVFSIFRFHTDEEREKNGSEEDDEENQGNV